jgi:NADH:ubiquinone oxidoreductase subunit 6 (subunit J)
MNLLAAISGSGLVHSLIYLLIAGIILGLVLWLVGKSPVPEPFKSVLTWIVYAVAVLILINFLLGLIGRPFITF